MNLLEKLLKGGITMFNKEQKQFINEHLRRPENDIAIAKIAYQMVSEFEKVGGTISPELAQQTAILMNLGETDSRIAYIYDSSYNWKEHPEAIELNKLHGQYSVEMAESIGINLTEEQKSTITGHSKGEYSSALGQIIKIAEICKATESPRWYRGEKKEPAQTWGEVIDVLKEDPNLLPQMIRLAEVSYGKSHFKSCQIEEMDQIR